MLVLGYGVICYGLFFATFLYLIGFVSGFVVPKAMNDGTTGSLAVSVLINFGLILLFGLQHSVMARPTCKKRITQYIPEAAERSTFVLATCAVLALTFWLWRPLPNVIWDLKTPALRGAVHGLSFAGWGLVLYSSFLINHFDLFGLRQVVLHFRGRKYFEPGFCMPLAYKLIRNPLMLGMVIGICATPSMTVGHLMFATFMTTYIFIGVYFEERDLAKKLGPDYVAYRQRTPMLVPRLQRGRGAKVALEDSGTVAAAV
ncbi:MAG: methanethiol S-methyltransferase [Phycisphaerae bacterium]